MSGSVCLGLHLYSLQMKKFRSSGSGSRVEKELSKRIFDGSMQHERAVFAFSDRVSGLIPRQRKKLRHPRGDQSHCSLT